MVKLKVSVNVNDKVSVKLTQKGVDILKRKREEINENLDIKLPEITLQAGDIYETQLWCLMNDFSEYLYNGCELPFETDIEFE